MTASLRLPEDVPAVDEPYRIFLVEDDSGDAVLVEELLYDTGLKHTLRWKQTLAEAVGELTRQPADCVVVDLHLPDASGMAVLSAVQQACPQAAVIVLTGLGDAQSGIRAVSAGAQDYLIKGQVDGALMQRALRYAVHRKQAEQASAELRENRIRAQENTRLERGLLPTPLLHGDTVAVTTRYLPGRERAQLGGDFLDVVETTDGTVHAVIGDVSGHGPDEAALGVCLRITWRALVLAGHRGVELLDLLEQVLVAERTRYDMFATCTLVELDLPAARATVHLAGHHEPLLIADSTGPAEAAHGIALGIAPGLHHWQPSTIALPPSGALMLYTDGLIEGHRGPGPERLDTEGLVDLIARAPRLNTPAFLDQLISAAQQLNAGRHADDLAILHLGWGGTTDPVGSDAAAPGRGGNLR
ncbi:PP2C family protein-serine/threonine phosphatase [Kitasatospora mediocidica]|uniref:PP2C family protein-serine/threonine phosphatase n=1 Tax=Kitasatospora mediocidica TaxID=58352 RepID=UPI00068D2046|nr:fused response regulator/phosphatase [Kitasatospora mediocidica]